jgi:transcriptional regulator with XRE-family HTH domain
MINSQVRINGEILKDARTTQGLAIEKVAMDLCVSKTHIFQIEDGGEGAFYSYALKVQIAKKLALYLKVPESAAFDSVEEEGIEDFQLTLQEGKLGQRLSPIEQENYSLTLQKNRSSLKKVLYSASIALIFLMALIFIQVSPAFQFWNNLSETFQSDFDAVFQSIQTFIETATAGSAGTEKVPKEEGLLIKTSPSGEVNQEIGPQSSPTK